MKKLTILFLAMVIFSCNNQPDKGASDNNSEIASQGKIPKTEKEVGSNTTINDYSQVETEKAVEPDTIKTNDNQDINYQPADNNNTNQFEDNFIGFASFYMQFDKPKQTFILKADEDKTITCKEGTKLTVNENSFITSSGDSVTGDIEIRVKEYYKISDILLANLSTTSNRDILETGGMIYIEAFSNGEECELKKGATIEIAFPAKDKKDDMQLFSGNWESDKVNWILKETIPVDSEENAGFTFVEKMPEFPGGQQKLMDYLSKNIKYPTRAKESGIQGTVYITFIVNEDGNTEDIRVVRGVDSSLNQAAISAIEQMPKWTPGKQGGEYVKVNMNLPIRFSLGGEDFSTNNIDYAKEFEKQVNDSNLSNTEMLEISHYIFSTSKLGWINCDRFFRDNSPKVDFLVNIGTSKQVDIKIVFNTINSILTGSTSGGKYIFDNVPTGHSVTLVALKYEKDQYYLAIKKTKITREEEQVLDFEPVTMARLKAEMEKLNRI
ncbi:MAG: hypothetical protein CVT99_08770 [Bacteroidetes bacterium HGW-Bacteroidetes-16]|jgi:TonB family protein|nr:MAG: hypothetical protein CVT99_08770 [Bacteroidetes bacterium HGW-Bacteroidetes-16]